MARGSMGGSLTRTTRTTITRTTRTTTEESALLANSGVSIEVARPKRALGRHHRRARPERKPEEAVRLL
jgi:hypothetical protein